MKISYLTLNNWINVEGAVVVIDVFRAFSTAGYAFEAGAKSIQLVGDVEEAFRIRQANPQVRLMGEVRGIRVEGFEYGNSPLEFLGENLRGVDLVQRTSAGTQGIIRAQQASILLAASFCCAGATARYLKRLSLDSISFVNTGVTEDGRGDEDVVCADYISGLLNDEAADPGPFLDRVRSSKNANLLAYPPLSSPQDIDYCCELDRFNFAMVVENTIEGLFLHKVELT